MNVANAGTIHGLLAADPGRMVVGPFADGKANVSTIHTRFIMAIPNCYMSLFLAHRGGGVTPRYYFDTILPVIKAMVGPTRVSPSPVFAKSPSPPRALTRHLCCKLTPPLTPVPRAPVGTGKEHPHPPPDWLVP